MQIVAGLSLSNLKPRVWDAGSPYHLPELGAVMVSYADFHRAAGRRRSAMEQGLHNYLGIPRGVHVYLDNGAFYFLRRDWKAQREDYETFVAKAKPDWYPIPQDFIPTPAMTEDQQRLCITSTMEVNLEYQHDGYTPVIHISRLLEEYTVRIAAHEKLVAKPAIALGGIVPNLLRAPKAMPYKDILNNLKHVRQTFKGKRIHIFGIGGTATLHIAALLGMDSVDSSGWRNRAARGLIQMPGTGDRFVAELGNWRGREPTEQEWEKLQGCECPACREFKLEGIRSKGIEGFCNRATHNLWVLLEEARLINHHIAAGTYRDWYKGHLNNSTYRPLIEQILEASPCIR